MTRLKAKRKLQRHGQDGNWRFKGLLLAAFDSDVTAESIAEAWPSPGHPSDYRFLSEHESRNPEQEADRRVVAERGEARHRELRDFVKNTDNTPKHLSSDPTDEIGRDSLGCRLDDAIPRMLFGASSYEEINTLFREQLLETVMNGATRRRVARDASNVINSETRRGDVPVASDDEFAPKIQQGAEIRDSREDYDTIAFDTDKHGQGARVTDEMQDHAMIDMIERQIEHVGRAVENAINRQWLNTLVDNANGNFDTAGSDQGYSGLNGAFGVVDEEDFIPDTYVTHPEFRTVLYDDSNLSYANRAGTDEVLRERGSDFESIAGLDLHAASSGATYDSGSNTWGYGSDGDYGAVVYDRQHVHVVMYSPDGQGITIKDYDDPIRDLDGVNARCHTDTIYSQQRASATVEY